MKASARLLLDRSIAPSLARFIVVFVLMVAPWPGLGRTFTDTVGAIATAIADPLTSASNVTFQLRSPNSAEGLPDWRGVIAVRQDFPEGPVAHAGAIDLRRCGYLQLAMFAALAAAWPPRGRRQTLVATALAAGIVSTTIALPILAFLSPLGAVHLGAWLETLVSLASRALVAAPGMAYAVPGIAWLAVHGGEAFQRVTAVTNT
jgi:hypothetical protein